MIRFIIKGLLRDKHRSLLPVIVVSLGVMLTVFMHCWLKGAIGDSIEINARFSTGHVKIMSRSYAEYSEQIPNDLALTNVSDIRQILNEEYPQIKWVDRIKFGGLVDAPDENGETRAQGPAIGFAVDLLSENSLEIERMNLKSALVRGKFPSKSGEILLSEKFAQNLDVSPGEEISLISSTMYGSMSIYNFIVSGTVNFGISAMDKGAMVVDLEDARMALDMFDATGEILGFFESGYFDSEEADLLCENFNGKYSVAEDEFSPQMLSMRDQSNLAAMIDMSDKMSSIIIFVFIFVMSIVLWNAGLLSGIRRYGEVGIRLAVGEEKGHVYRSLIAESVVIGLIGSVIGTIVGLGFAYILQTKGIDISGMIDGSSIMMPSVMRARITPAAFVLGFIPGLFSTVLGTALSGFGIYKRKTAQLFKELEY